MSPKDTDFVGSVPEVYDRVLVPLISVFGARTPEQGADTLIHAATSAEVAGLTGAFLADRKVKKPSRAARG